MSSLLVGDTGPAATRASAPTVTHRRIPARPSDRTVFSLPEVRTTSPRSAVPRIFRENENCVRCGGSAQEERPATAAGRLLVGKSWCRMEGDCRPQRGASGQGPWQGLQPRSTANKTLHVPPGRTAVGNLVGPSLGRPSVHPANAPPFAACALAAHFSENSSRDICFARRALIPCPSRPRLAEGGLG